ncbi:hypothetical protein SAMN05421690_103517 [Nitrosomonas sp. Nm51]|nr:hypothetical protein SAMN05421690_103517 [Nitrosomonas sp. Nm51]
MVGVGVDAERTDSVLLNFTTAVRGTAYAE